MADGRVKVNGGIFGQQRIGVAAHADDGNTALVKVGDEAKQFVGLPRIGEGKDDVAVGDDAHITVEGVERVDEETGRAGAGKGGGYLVADVAALADARDNEFAVAV